jgi:two-component system response regulator
MTESGTILLVEDNPDDEALTLRALKKNHIDNEVLVARDGEKALAVLFGDTANQPLPRLTLLDLKLPRLSGFEVLKRLRLDTKTKWMPVVVLTSSKEDEDILQSYALGANAYLRKPVDFAQFTDAVKTLGRFWLELNEVVPTRAIPRGT